MQREEVYEAWTPPAGAWSLWVRPVLFAQLPEATAGASQPAGAGDPWPTLDVSWAPPADDHTLMMVDLPREEAVYTGLALVRRGYRPVPLFNGCTGPSEVIPQGAIQRALCDGAAYLRAQDLLPSAPPAFLLDQLRQAPIRPLQPGVFDNRWRVYPEDIPSAELLRARGFTRVVLVQRSRRWPQYDLRQVLWYRQQAGLAVQVVDQARPAPPEPVTLFRPPWYRRFGQRLLDWLGVKRSPVGGFGFVIPQPTHG
jgi:hypothetical protein